MRIISIHKAQATVKSMAVEPVTISITEDIPDFETLPKAAAHYEKQARELEAALRSVLPGGTYNRLLAVMMEKSAGYFRVPLGE